MQDNSQVRQICFLVRILFSWSVWFKGFYIQCLHALNTTTQFQICTTVVYPIPDISYIDVQTAVKQISQYNHNVKLAFLSSTFSHTGKMIRLRKKREKHIVYSAVMGFMTQVAAQNQLQTVKRKLQCIVGIDNTSLQIESFCSICTAVRSINRLSSLEISSRKEQC